MERNESQARAGLSRNPWGAPDSRLFEKLPLFIVLLLRLRISPACCG
jgi:hypothetical protein